MDIMADAEAKLREDGYVPVTAADTMDDWRDNYTSATYICDRLKTFDRVGF